MSFDWEMYSALNPDLNKSGFVTKQQLEKHYIIFARAENRVYDIYQVYQDFNPQIYREKYIDLQKMNKRELELHWLRHGRYEDRTYNYNYEYKKVSIVMAYYNRKNQTLSTLDSFNKHYLGKYNFEVIIVDDCSNSENRLDDIINNYNFKIIYRYITFEEKGNRVNPCSVYNIGFKLATGDVVIIQNPECYHYTNIINNIKSLDLSSNYYTALVMSSPSFNHNNFITNNTNMIKNNMINYLEKENIGQPYAFSKGWYNHPICPNIENHHLHFCSIISKEKLDILGGFDETYGNNYWYDDNEFLFRVKKILNPCFMMNTLVIHLFHENGSASHNNKNIVNSREINRLKYEGLKKTRPHEKISWK
jgi:hypothetical protein